MKKIIDIFPERYAVNENINLKKKVFANLDKVCPSHTILAMNTSVLSIIDIAKATNRMDKVLGLHFFGHVPIMKRKDFYDYY